MMQKTLRIAQREYADTVRTKSFLLGVLGMPILIVGLVFIAGKTAALCACCCRLGAHYAGADEDRREAYGRFGHNLGIAFQIADDVLDLLGDELGIFGGGLGHDPSTGWGCGIFVRAGADTPGG